MTRYRRAFVRGGWFFFTVGWFFFTVVTEQRRPVLATAAAVGVLREAFRTVRAKHPFDLDAIVVLPDHLHCIWRLPPEDADFATRWRLIKTWFTKHCDPALHQRHVSRDPLVRYGRYPGIWQHRYWEHLIRDEMDYSRHADYIHHNPVKHGYVNLPIDWPYSSFRKFVAAGAYAADWGSRVAGLEDVGHE